MSNNTNLPMTQLIQLSQGNPGTLNCLMKMLTGDIKDSIAGITIINKMQELSILGTNIYILWSDLSNKNYQLMAHFCNVVPAAILIDAASRQDYSGRELLNEYVLTFKSN